MPDAALPLFEFEGQPLRVHLDDAGEPWFVAKDVALALGYQWNGSARIAHVPEEWKRVTSVVTPSVKGHIPFSPLRRSNGFLPPLDTSPRFRHPEIPLIHTGVTVAFVVPHTAKSAVFFVLPSAHLLGVEYILARRRPVSVRTGGCV